MKIVVEFIEYELFTSFQRYIISILPIHSEYPGSLCIWQVFQIQFPRTTKSPLERKNFISPFFPPFIFAYKITSTSCSKRPSKKSVTENSAKTSSLSSLPPHIIDTPPSPFRKKLRSTFPPSPLEFVYSFLRKRARGREGRDRSALRREFKCRCKRFWNSKNRESVLNTQGKLEFYARFNPGSSEKGPERWMRDVWRRKCIVISKRLKLMRRVRGLFGDSVLFLIRKVEREFYRWSRILWIYLRERFLRKIWVEKFRLNW